MTIIARSARIEAVVFDRGLDLDSFTHEASRLTRTVHSEISGCVADHAKLTGLIKVAAGEQSALDRDFRERLLGLARELSDTFAMIQTRQDDGRDLMGEVAKGSDRIAQTAGLAMVSLQSGDSTRQRLEHVSRAVRCAIELGGAARPEIEVPESARPSTIAALCRLQDAQLRDTVTEFGVEAGQIDAAFQGLMSDVRDLVERSQATYGSGDGTSESFLTVFRSKLSVAVGLLRTCAASRQAVKDATTQLRAMLDGLNQTIASLNSTSLDLTLLAINAGLRATRLGSEGRSLIVIADELKRLAEKISDETTGLMQVFTSVERTSHRLDRDGEGKSVSGVAAVDQEMVIIVDRLDAGDRKAADILRLLDACARAFDADLNRARRDFKTAITKTDDLIDVAHTLATLALDPDVDTEATVGGFVSAIVSPTYTMARERAVHAELFGSPGESGEQDARSDDAVEDWDMSECLFG